jgi:hypothetical protein
VRSLLLADKLGVGRLVPIGVVGLMLDRLMAKKLVTVKSTPVGLKFVAITLVGPLPAESMLVALLFARLAFPGAKLGKLPSPLSLEATILGVTELLKAEVAKLPSKAMLLAELSLEKIPLEKLPLGFGVGKLAPMVVLFGNGPLIELLLAEALAELGVLPAIGAPLVVSLPMGPPLEAFPTGLTPRLLLAVSPPLPGVKVLPGVPLSVKLLLGVLPARGVPTGVL